MTHHLRSNIGAAKIKRRKRAGCPMRMYDDLPKDVRVWLSQADLPWSPQSCRRIWMKARQQGLSVAQAVARLEAAEKAMLDRRVS